jgi:hypothetical protein
MAMGNQSRSDFLSVLDHRAKLEYGENSALKAQALLAKKDWALGIELDCHCTEKHNGSRDQNQKGCAE